MRPGLQVRCCVGVNKYLTCEFVMSDIIQIWPRVSIVAMLSTRVTIVARIKAKIAPHSRLLVGVVVRLAP